MSNTGFAYSEKCDFPSISPKGFPLRDSDDVMGLITHILFFGSYPNRNCSIRYIGFYKYGKLEEIFFINHENILETIDILKDYVRVKYKYQE